MRWMGATLALLGACFALTSWLYLRDRDTSGVVVLSRGAALSDARLALERMTGRPGTCDGCRVEVLGSSSPQSWRVQLQGPFGSRCFDIDLDAFAVSSEHGVTGIATTGCERSGRS